MITALLTSPPTYRAAPRPSPSRLNTRGYAWQESGQMCLRLTQGAEGTVAECSGYSLQGQENEED